MANLLLDRQDSWRKDRKEPMYTVCFPASPRNGEGEHYKRSYSAPPHERGRHPHIRQLHSQSQNKLKLQPLEISKRENIQAALFSFPSRLPPDNSRFSFRITAKKDVDGSQSKMRESSGIEHKRKRKKRQHSTDLTSPQSLEDSSALPSNIENEGIATSCKRIKPNGPQTKKHHNKIFEFVSHSTSASPEETLDDSTLDCNKAAVGVDGDAPVETFESGDRSATKRTGRFLARYLAGTNSYPDYGPIAGQVAVALPSGRSRMMAGERKVTGIPGSFRPVNTLQSSGNNSSILPRPGHKKVFDLHEHKAVWPSDEPRAVKRQKFSTEKRNRKESSVSLVDISADSVQTGMGRNVSSTNSTPVKVVQSVSSRSHHPNVTSVGRLGGVEEYQRTEAMVGFEGRKRRKVSDEFERRRSFRSEVENGGRRQRASLISEPLITATQIATPALGTGKGKNPILIEDLEEDDEKESSQKQKHVKDKNRKSIPDPESKEISVIAERSRHFANPKGHGDGQNFSIGAAASSPTSWVTTETLKGEGPRSPDSFQSLGNGVEEYQNPEDDSIDLIKSDSVNIKVDETEKKVAYKDSTMKLSTIPKSKSISQHGDIPQSAFSGVRLKSGLNRNGQMLEEDLMFNVRHMQSGPTGFISKEDSDIWSIRYDYERKEFDITMGDYSVSEKYSTLVLKPEKIHKVKYHYDSLKVVIARALDYSSGAQSQVLVEMTTSEDVIRFAQSLKGLHSTINLSEVASEKLDNIFNTTLRNTPLTTPDSKDIALLQVKEARLAEKLNQAANIGRRRSSTAERVTSATTQRQSIANRMQSSTRPAASASSESAKAALLTGDDLSTSNRSKKNNGRDTLSSRPATRASERRSSEGQLQVHRSRSHSPIGWTIQNPHWKEEHSWESSLKFPMESKKWTKVDAEDIERLDEGAFLNDNLVGFYLRYLQYMLEKDHPELARRVYFQNTYFYSTLMKGKVRSNNINYEAVKRWTTKDKVDIFSYDYIVVPVCEKLHWYVAIICNAPTLLPRNDPDASFSTNAEDDTVVLTNVTTDVILGEGINGCNRPGMLNKEKEPIGRASASPSVIAQVEQMSLEDQEWPEPDALPDMLGSSIAQPRNLQTTEMHSNDNIEDNESEGHIQKEDIRHKIKKSKRKSMPPTRKHDPHDPRIITLDSLGQAHSPTCSNLREYLVCEARERHNVEIIPGRLGMTAKGLPEQSNYCDCGVFVLGYIEKFLEDPDEFIHSILQGDIAVGMASTKFDASKLREEIRELIFKLQADQVRQNNAQRRQTSEPNEAPITEARSRLSRKIMDGRSSPAAQMEAISYDSASAEPVLRPDDQSVTSRNKDAGKAKSLKPKRPLSSVLSGLATDWLENTESESIIILEGSGPGRLSNSTGHPVPGHPVPTVEGSEIMETPTLSEDDGVLPVRENTSQDSSIPLESPLHSDILKSIWEKSPDIVVGAKVDNKSGTNNVFKEFAKNADLPFQNTRNKTRYYSFGVSGSRKGLPLEVRETPPRNTHREASPEEAREPHSRPRRSSAVVSDHKDSLDLEVISPSRIAKRKGGTNH